MLYPLRMCVRVTMSLTIGVSMFLREAMVDCGGSFSEGALHVAIGGIQDHVAITYVRQEIIFLRPAEHG